MGDVPDGDRLETRRRIQRDETLAIVSGVTLALLVVGIVLVYLWFV